MQNMVDLKWNIRHDYFNLITLPIVFIHTTYYLYFNSFADVYEYYIFLIYIILDTIWIVLIPSCVASPLTIIIHHIVCILGWNILYLHHKYFYWLSYGLLVEINTWLLIAKRNYNSVLLNILFYLTWIILRLIMYPIILILFSKEYYQVSIQYNSIFNDSFIILIIIILLNCLNIKWSYDLFSKPIKIFHTNDNIKDTRNIKRGL